MRQAYGLAPLMQGVCIAQTSCSRRERDAPTVILHFKIDRVLCLMTYFSGVKPLHRCKIERLFIMRKVAVFGNTGGGKSTLSKRLATIAHLPLHVLDKIQYRVGGTKVSDDDYKRAHAEILATHRWIVDGFGSMETLWLRLDEADTLIYIDLPLPLHVWWVTKRLLTGFFVPPDGWPDRAPILKSSITSYQTLWRCHKYLTPRYRDYVDRVQSTKRVYHLTSTKQIAQFFASIETEIDGV